MTHLSIALLNNLSDALRSAILGGMSEPHRDALWTVARIVLWPARHLNPATAPSAPPCPPGDRPADRPAQKEDEAPPAPGQDPSPLAETPVEDPPVKAPPAGASLSTDEAYDYYSFEDSASGGVDEESEDSDRGVSPYTTYAYNISYSLDEESEDSDMEAREAYSIEEEDEISPYSYYSTESSDEVLRTASAMGSPLASLSAPDGLPEDLMASLNTALGRPSSGMDAEDLMASLSAALGRAQGASSGMDLSASSGMDAGMLGSFMDNLMGQLGGGEAAMGSQDPGMGNRSVDAVIDNLRTKESRIDIQPRSRSFHKTRRSESKSKLMDRSDSWQKGVRQEHNLINKVITLTARLDQIGSLARFFFGWRPIVIPETEQFRDELRKGPFQERTVSIVKGTDYIT